jgi:transposase
VSSFTYNHDAVFIGLDVHKDSISVGILNPGHDSADVEKMFNDPESMRRLIGRFDDPSRLRVCYEAGPTGFDLARDLRRMGVACEVIAPSMIPKAPGDRVKTDARDCRRLARLHRAGELVAVRVPAPIEEAVRDLCRTRGDMVEDLTRARHRLSKFLLATRGSGGAGLRGPSSTRRGWLPNASRRRPFRPPSITTGPSCCLVTPRSRRSRQT